MEDLTKKLEKVYVENAIGKTSGKEYSLLKLQLAQGVTLEYFLDSKDKALLNLWLATLSK
jgi:hypothetical protein